MFNVICFGVYKNIMKWVQSMPERLRTSPQYESFHELYKNYTTKDLTQKLSNYSKLNKKLVLAIMPRWKKMGITWRVF